MHFLEIAKIIKQSRSIRSFVETFHNDIMYFVKYYDISSTSLWGPSIIIILINFKTNLSLSLSLSLSLFLSLSLEIYIEIVKYFRQVCTIAFGIIFYGID